MKMFLFLAASLLVVQAHAAKFITVDGKQMKPGPAKVALMKNPKAVVLEIQARQVEISETSGNFKKLKDLTPAETIKALQNVKAD